MLAECTNHLHNFGFRRIDVDNTININATTTHMLE